MTDEIDFPEDQQFPPTIIDVAGSEVPIGSIFWVDLDKPTNEWRLPVAIRDENVDEVLEARHRVLTEDNNVRLPKFTSEDVPPSGGLMREHTVTVQLGDIQLGKCHRVELVVSGSFINRTMPPYFDVLRGDDDDDDIARASWIVWEGKGDIGTLADEKAVLAASCDSIETFLQEEALAPP